MAAIKQSALAQIPQRNKDLAFGYVREKERGNNAVLPEMIKYLCLIYLNQNRAKFALKYCAKSFEFDGNKIKNKMEDGDFATCLCASIATRGRHVWKWRVIQGKFTCGNSDMIGIVNEQELDDMEESPSSTICERQYLDQIVRGYGFLTYGRLSHPFNCNTHGRGYGVRCKNGWIIDMILDFNDWSLSFRLNGIDYGKAFYVKPGRYRAGITLKGGNQYEFVSHQMFY